MLAEKLLPKSENKMLIALNDIINEIESKSMTYVIWGAGNTGRETEKYIHEKTKGRISVRYTVDNNSSLWSIEGIRSPEYFVNDMSNVDIVLVCVYVADQIVEQLKNIGYFGKTIVVSSSIFSISDDDYRIYEENIPIIEEIYQRLADEQSRCTLETYLNVMRTGDVALWASVNGNSRNKLLDDEVLDLSINHNFVDVGAFIGDTLEAFLRQTNNTYRSIVCIEPDKRNYSELNKKIALIQKEDVYAINAAVGEKTGTIRFAGEKSESCHVSDDVGEEIKMIALDDVNAANDASLLKVSTNGFDLKALKGAEKTIVRNKPQIATYASGSQMWTIPMYLWSIVPEYDIYMRHYGVGRQALICYAKRKGSES